MKLRLAFEWTDPGLRGNIVDEREFAIKDANDIANDIKGWVEEMFASDSGKDRVGFEITRRYGPGDDRVWLVYGTRNDMIWKHDTFGFARYILSNALIAFGWERIDDNNFKNVDTDEYVKFSGLKEMHDFVMNINK